LKFTEFEKVLVDLIRKARSVAARVQQQRRLHAAPSEDGRASKNGFEVEFLN
jgi:hypothetical protein